MLPPFTDLRSVQTLVDADKLQDHATARRTCPRTTAGAYTGEIVRGDAGQARLHARRRSGHSERRQYHAEDDAVVNAKVRPRYRHGLTPIVCVGEGLDVRKAGDQVAHTLAQVDGGLAGLTAEQAAALVVAYEPVWAIGTGEVATPEDAQEVCGAIRTRLAERYSGDGAADGVRILYGGSVKASNVAGDHGAARRRRRPGRAARAWTPTSSSAIVRFRLHPADEAEPAAAIQGRQAGERPSRVRILVRPGVGTGRPTSLAGRKWTVILALEILLMITSLLLIVLVLLHRGKGGGLSDMFGGGVSSSVGGSSVAERNLDRLTRRPAARLGRVHRRRSACC